MDGINQIRAAKEIINKLGLEIPVYGMVKNDKHKTRALIDENRNEFELPANGELFNFITFLQDEVHKTAIEYHRKLRNQKIRKSELDNINGIGEKKKQLLLKHFGSVEKIKKASIEELTKLSGIDQKLAEKIKEELN